MIELWASPEAWAALLTLTALEIVLGIDNVIFLSVVVSRIPQPQAKRARQIGLALALVFRILLLSLLVWLIGLTQAVLTVRGIAFSWRDIILIGGGLFLIAKATHEIHTEVEARDGGQRRCAKGRRVVLGDRPDHRHRHRCSRWIPSSPRSAWRRIFEIMIAAVVIACLMMYISSGPVARFRSGASDHQDAGAGVSGADRRRAGRGRISNFISRAATSTFAIAFSAAVEVLQCPGQTQPQETSVTEPSQTLSAAIELTTRPRWLSLGIARRDEC